MTRPLLAAQALILAVLTVLVGDVYAHKRVEHGGGVNVWGYRGSVVRQRQPGDMRLLYVGGTRAYGYGGASEGTIAYRLERDLNVNGDRPATVINASRIGAVAADYAAIISQYGSLQSDYVVIHDDLGRAATRPRRSRVAALTGYTPILPLFMEEKGMQWRYGSVAAAYQGEAPPRGFFARSAGATLQSLGRALRSLESPEAPLPAVDHTTAMMAGVDAALAHSLGVLIVVDPAAGEETSRNRAVLFSALNRHPDRAKIRMFDAATVTGMEGVEATLDGYSYNALARQRLGMALAPVVMEFAGSRRH